MTECVATLSTKTEKKESVLLLHLWLNVRHFVSPRQPLSCNMSIIMVVGFCVYTTISTYPRTQFLAGAQHFITFRLMGKRYQIHDYFVVTFYLNKLEVIVLTFMMFALSMIWFVEATHDPSKQVNTSPTQQPFSASPLLLPSTSSLYTNAHTCTLMHKCTSSSSSYVVNYIINVSVIYLSVLTFQVCICCFLVNIVVWV